MHSFQFDQCKKIGKWRARQISKKKIFEIYILNSKFSGQVQLTVNGSSNRTLIERFLNSRNLFQVRLGYVKVPQIEEAFDSRNLLPSTALVPFFPPRFFIYFVPRFSTKQIKCKYLHEINAKLSGNKCIFLSLKYWSIIFSLVQWKYHFFTQKVLKCHIPIGLLIFYFEKYRFFPAGIFHLYFFNIREFFIGFIKNYMVKSPHL